MEEAFNQTEKLTRTEKLFQDNTDFTAQQTRKQKEAAFSNEKILLNMEVEVFLRQKKNLEEAFWSILEAYAQEINRQEFLSNKDKLNIIEIFIDNLDILGTRIESYAKSLSYASNPEKITQFRKNLKLLNTSLIDACDTTLAYDISFPLATLGFGIGIISVVMIISIGLVIMTTPAGITAVSIGLTAKAAKAAAVLFLSLEIFGAFGLAGFATALPVYLMEDEIKKNAVNLKPENLGALVTSSQTVDENYLSSDSSEKSQKIAAYKNLFFSSSPNKSEEKPVEKTHFLTKEEVQQVQAQLTT